MPGWRAWSPSASRGTLHGTDSSPSSRCAGAFGMGLGTGFGAFALRADDHPRQEDPAQRQPDTEQREPPGQLVRMLHRLARIAAALFKERALAVDQPVERAVDLKERIRLS